MRGMMIIFLCQILVWCGCVTEKATLQTKAYQQIAYERYGERAEYLFNRNKSHVICLTKNDVTPKLPQQHLRFFIYDIASSAILLEDEIPNGTIEWKNDRLVVVTSIPGTVKLNEEDKAQGWEYDVRTKTRNSLQSVKH